MQIPRIDPKNLQGLSDKVIGLVKEIVGTFTGQDKVTKAGRVQQQKGSERLKAVEHQVKADLHEAKAEAAEKQQKAAQSIKEEVNA